MGIDYGVCLFRMMRFLVYFVEISSGTLRWVWLVWIYFVNKMTTEYGWWDLMRWSSKFVYICDALVTQTSMAFLNRLFIFCRSRSLAVSPGIAVRRLTVQRKSVESLRITWVKRILGEL
jgi:hypothetical protein